MHALLQRRTFAAVVLLGSVALAGQPERYSNGLSARDAAEARDGIVMLRPLPSGRVLVPGGTFTMGSTPMQMLSGVALCEREPLGPVKVPYELQNGIMHAMSAHCDAARFMAEGVAHAVTVSSFYMDRTEVTVADYKHCVSAGSCNPPGFTPGDARFDAPRFPVTSVSWTDARDYCTFSHARLPTEAEWELAARGLAGRIFPWGNVWNPHLANHGSIALDPTDATDGFAGLAPVGSIPDGKTPLGLLDMAGNVDEWVADQVEIDPERSTASRELVPMAYAPSPQTNPRGTTGTMRMVRGGSFLQGADAQRATARTMALESRRLPGIGFRCASDP